MPYIEIDHQARPVGPGVLTIGSGSESSWRIPERGLSPVHVIVVPERDGRASVVQGSPDARVVVNGAELEGGWHVLAIGDEIRIGELTAVYCGIPSALQVASEGYLRDTQRGRLYRIAEQSQIGRDLRCTVLLQEPDVSRLHADILSQGAGFLLRPRGGVTLLNGERITEPMPLKEGDELVIGRTHLRFSREVPRNAPVIGASQANSRAARMATTFIGTVAMREKLEATTRRKIGRMALIVGAVALAVAALVAVWGAAPQPAEATGARALSVQAAPAAEPVSVSGSTQLSQ